ncbi:MAG: TRAP transporter large permease subunit, partial [Halobacteriovoraceae bacterium]|nr:TRAP transporter large permease subunit [Halobacteriovoraceae bacterium]
LPIIIIGGIYTGLITPTEAAAISAFYVVIIECFWYKDLSLSKDIPNVIKESMSLVGAILLILCCALGLTNYLVDEEIPLRLLDFIREFVTNKYVFLLLLNIFLLGVGAMMDIFSAIIVVVPLILPIAEEFGIDPIHLAIIFLTNLEIGYITPPVGINLFISSFRFDKSVLTLYKVVIPYLILLLIALVLITYIPWLTLVWF